MGQAGKPKTITGFQTHTTPVLLAYGERAELATDECILVLYRVALYKPSALYSKCSFKMFCSFRIILNFVAITFSKEFLVLNVSWSCLSAVDKLYRIPCKLNP